MFSLNLQSTERWSTADEKCNQTVRPVVLFESSCRMPRERRVGLVPRGRTSQEAGKNCFKD